MASGLGHFFPPPTVTRSLESGKQAAPLICLPLCLPFPPPTFSSSLLVPAPSSPYSSLFLTFLGGGGEGQENNSLPSLVRVLT